MPLPTDSAERKRIPLYSGVLAYFPDALAGVARISWEGNEKHNPGEPLHWARGKSDDHEDCIARHTQDALQAASLSEKVAHMRARAWRALAALQLAEEELAADKARGGVAHVELVPYPPGPYPTLAPQYCPDCGADLSREYHSYACLKGTFPRVG